MTRNREPEPAAPALAGGEDSPAGDFERRLAAARARAQPEPRQVALSAMAGGTRHAVEMVATTAVGGFLGWWLDRWLGTAPVLMLLLVLVGLAAGFWNLWRGVERERLLVEQQQEPLPGGGSGDDAGPGRRGGS